MRIIRRIYWLPILVVGLTAILSPCAILAQAEKVDLTLRLVSDSYYSRITAGEDKTIFLEIGNAGKKGLTNIRLYADLPEDWSAEFRPGLIDYLGPGSFQAVDMILRPADNTAKGNYTVALIAEANETRRVTSIFVRVESASLLWLSDL
ncbi:NEW3 domain-containing protein [Chloroflexota bacterium]